MLGSAICVIDRSSASNTIAALTTKRTSGLLVRGIPTTATPRAECLPTPIAPSATTRGCDHAGMGYRRSSAASISVSAMARARRAGPPAPSAWADA